MRLLDKGAQANRILMNINPSSILHFDGYPLFPNGQDIVNLWFGRPLGEVRDVQIWNICEECANHAFSKMSS